MEAKSSVTDAQGVPCPQRGAAALLCQPCHACVPTVLEHRVAEVLSWQGLGGCSDTSRSAQLQLPQPLEQGNNGRAL